MSSPWLSLRDPKANAGFQGIEYLELHPLSATLVVHLQQPWTTSFTAESVAITGGRRAAFMPGDWSIASQSLADRTLTLHLHHVGDASEHTVTLLDGAGLPVHPYFASSKLLFNLDCERGDCRPLAESPPRPVKQRPAVDLLTKDYAGFVTMLADWVRVKNPHWADLSPTSLERVLVELLSHHGDMLSYYQDRVANESFIDTASQRYSLRQHATLLGTRLFDGAAAETVLAFQSSSDGHVPEGIEVTIPEGVGDAAVVFYVTDRTRVLVEHSDLVPAAWPGAGDATVPAGATEMLLWGKVKNLVPGQQLAVVQGSFTGVVPFSQIITVTSSRNQRMPGWAATPSAHSHTGEVDVTVIAFDPPLARAVRPWDASLPFHLFGNLARARAGRRVDRGKTANSTTFPLIERVFRQDRQSFLIEHLPGFPEPILRALRVPESPVVFEAGVTSTGAATSTPVIGVTIRKERWSRVEHLHNSRSYDRHYVATADEDGSLWLEFGDGRAGKAVKLQRDAEAASSPTSDEIVLDYRVGAPIAGNIGAGILTRFVPGQKGFEELADLTIVNVLPGTGGRQPETRDAARLRIPASLRRGPMEHAVSLDDYAQAAMGVEVGEQRVARAAAKRLGGPFNAVLVLVDPEGQTGLSEALRLAVHDRIDALRMAGREHFVSAADYVPIEVELAVCAETGARPHRVRAAVLAALRPGDASRPGFFHPDRLSFGDELELGEVLAFVQRIAGVRAVKALRFRKLGVSSPRAVEARIELGSTEVIRMDGDDDHPEAGRLSVLIAGVDPGVTAGDFIIEEAP